MSTRSVVGVKSEKGLVGRYCHSDGYTDHILPTLRELIERDGPEHVGKVILSQGMSGWSYLSTTTTTNRLGSDQAEVIPGYGLAYRDAPADDPWTLVKAREDSGIEFAYFIDTDTGEIEWYDFYGNEQGIDRPVVVSTKRAPEGE